MHAESCIIILELINDSIMFVFVYAAETVVETCTPVCKNGGYCSSGYCHCTSGYWGSYCQYGGMHMSACRKLHN